MANTELLDSVKMTIMDNGRQIVREDKRLFHAFGGQIKASFKEYKLDRRTYSVSVNNTLDADEYLNYLSLYVTLLNTKSANIDATGYTIDLLDRGYMPLIIVPSFMTDDVSPFIKSFRQMVTNTKINGEKIITVSISARSLADKVIDNELKDIWISRMQWSEILNCRPEEVRLSNVIQKIMMNRGN